MEIREVNSYSAAVKSQIDDFLVLLTKNEVSFTAATLKEIISSDSSHLFFAFDADKNCMGMLTIGIYISPTGKKAWIEDVVVSESYRGQGIGKKLMDFAIQFVKEQGVSLLMLTSNPARVAANNLYVKLGFEKKETNVYRMVY